MNQPSPFNMRIFAARRFVVRPPQCDIAQLVERDQAGAQAVVDVVIVVGDFVGDVRDLGF